jgi:hypothetical protein
MRSKYFLLLLAAVALMALPAIAQNPTGTLTGSVTDGREALPGVTVTVSSPNLQGKRVAVSSINGDYIFRFLPPGEYQARFELQGFQTIETTVKLSAAQTARLDATMPQAAVAEEVTVTGAYETVSTTSTAATTYEKDLIEKLPVNRDLASAVLLTGSQRLHRGRDSGDHDLGRRRFLRVRSLRGRRHQRSHEVGRQ